MKLSNAIDRALEKSEWELHTLDGGIKVHRSPLLSQRKELVHAFSTRFGGESLAPMEWFNLGRHIDDQSARDDALHNRHRLCDALGLDFQRLVVPGQVHSSRVVSCDEKNFAQVDSVATNKSGTPILLHFADCVPIIIYAFDAPALAVVHAGWKGTAGMIAKNAVQFLCRHYGAQPEKMIAAVGPAIGPCCYPTGGDVAEQLARTVSDSSRMIDCEGEQPRPDLKALNALQLLESSVAAVDVSDLCTACRPDLFYSHRQSGGKTGRQGAIASMGTN